MLKIKLFSNYYNVLEKVSLLVVMDHLQQKYSIFLKVSLKMFLLGEKVEGEKRISAQGSSVKGSSQQSSTPGPKVKGGGPLFSGWAHLLWGGGVGKRYYTPILETLALTSQEYPLPPTSPPNGLSQGRLCVGDWCVETTTVSPKDTVSLCSALLIDQTQMAIHTVSHQYTLLRVKLCVTDTGRSNVQILQCCVQKLYVK